MRFGDWEIPGGLLVMPAFALVAAVLVLWSWYYYSAQRRELKLLAANRGWKFLGRNAAGLRLSLDELGTDTHQNWRPDNVIAVEGPPNSVYLFTYQVSASPSDESELGSACLAEHPAGRDREPVVIDPRPPRLLRFAEKLLDDRVEVGGPEFQREFMVQCRRQDQAAAVVTRGVQEVLLQRASGLVWNRVCIAGGRILVTVTLRLQPHQWDELVGLSKRLRGAVP